MPKKKIVKKRNHSRTGKPRGRPFGSKNSEPRKDSYDIKFIEKMAAKLVPWFMEDDKRFWLKDFAIEHGFWSGNMSLWPEKSKYFAEQLLLAKDIQESRLVHGGIGSKMNEGMVRRALQNVAGWRDAQYLGIGDSNGGPIKIQIIDFKDAGKLGDDDNTKQ